MRHPKGKTLQSENDEQLRNSVLLLLGVYFFANLVLRILISPSLAFDESEMVVVTQVLAWGYNNPPPLYPWVQAAFFWVFGFSSLFFLYWLEQS